MFTDITDVSGDPWEFAKLSLCTQTHAIEKGLFKTLLTDSVFAFSTL